MEQPGKLHDSFDSFNSHSEDPALDWAEMGPMINDALQKKETKKRRWLFFWLFGSTIIIAALIYITSDLLGGQAASHNQLEDSLEGYESQISEDQPHHAKATIAPVITQDSESDAKEISTDPKPLRQITDGGNREIEKERQHSDANGRISAMQQPAEKSPHSLTTITANTKANTAAGTTLTLTLTQSERLALNNTNTETPSREQLNVDYLSNKSPLLTYLTNPPLLFTDIKYISKPSTLDKKKLTLYTFAGLLQNDLHGNYQNTHALASTNLNVGMMLPLCNRFYLSAGVGLDQQRFQTGFVESQNIKLYRPGTPDTIFFYTNSQRVVFKDSIAGIGTRNFGHTNKVTSLNIPIEAGYRFQFGRLSVSAQLGVIFDIHQKIDFRIANNVNQIQNRQSSSSWNIRPGIVGSLALEFMINDKFSVVGRYRQSRQSVSPWEQDDHTTYSSRGVQVGGYISLHE